MELAATIAVVLFLLVLAWCLWGVIGGVMGAVVQVKSMPREPMEWCHKHGAFSRKHVLPLLNTTVCPRCYHDAWKKAGK